MASLSDFGSAQPLTVCHLLMLEHSSRIWERQSTRRPQNLLATEVARDVTKSHGRFPTSRLHPIIEVCTLWTPLFMLLLAGWPLVQAYPSGCHQISADPAPWQQEQKVTVQNPSTPENSECHVQEAAICFESVHLALTFLKNLAAGVALPLPG